MTYENAAEGALLKDLYSGRNDNLENTVFAMLGPDGKKRLTMTGRSPNSVYGSGSESAATMARAMKRHARRYGKSSDTKSTLTRSTEQSPAVPTVANLRLALNVASCENRPLVIVFHQEARSRRQLETNLGEVVWKKMLVGRSEYVVVDDPKELATIAQLRNNPKPGIYVVRPSTFGDRGRLIASIATDHKGAELAKELDAAFSKYRPREKSRGTHVATGQEIGVKWETQTPITDSRATRNSRQGRTRRRR